MKELEQAQIEALKAKHPHTELHQVSVGAGEREVTIIVQVPNRARWMRFKEQAADKNRKALALEALVHDCTVHPSQAELMALLEARPALTESFGGQIVELAGLEETVVAKKL
jgi:uncharacterized protein (DUF111 family)